MSLYRVRQDLRREETELERRSHDGHAPTAEAYRVLLGHLREDIAAVEAAIKRDEASPQLRAVVEAARGCSNSPCVITGPKTGMHTNGGCHCRQRLRDALKALDEVGHG